MVGGLSEQLGRLDERQTAHEDHDETRFGGLNSSLEEVKGDVKALRGDVTVIGADVAEIKGKLSGEEPHHSRWHVGKAAWAVAGGVLTMLLSLIGWLGAQVYDLQPARIQAASLPQAVRVIFPPPSAAPPHP